MPQLSHKQYDALERAIADGKRVAIWRRGTEYVVIPTRLRILDGRESVEARNPSTGDHLVLHLDEVEAIEVVW